MVGAGAMGRGIALQILRSVPGMELSAISNRHVETARDAYRGGGAEDVALVESVASLEGAIARGKPAVTDDPKLVCAAEGIDVVLEVTGNVEFGAGVVLDAIDNGKHVVTMNAELQGTLGPLLKARADSAGVVLTDSDGDQPGVIMNLYRFVEGIGVRPVLAGTSICSPRSEARSMAWKVRSRSPTTGGGRSWCRCGVRGRRGRPTSFRNRSLRVESSPTRSVSCRS